MSAPRQVLPGTTYFITRNCTQRQFWLTPSALVKAIFLYCLAYAANRFGIEIHAACVMSNHWHAVVTDTRGKLPDFLHWVHLFVGKCINTDHGREENLWSSDEPSYIPLEDDEAIFEKIVYTLANPVSACLVPSSLEWPGLRTRPSDIKGKEIVAARPPVFFRESGKTPEAAVLRITRPPIYRELSDEALAKRIDAALTARERSIHERMRKEGKTFVGVEAIMKQMPWESPSKPRRKSGRRPRFLASTKAGREAAAERLSSFRDRHADARRRFRAGERHVLFPPGTYAIVRFFGALVEPATARPRDVPAPEPNAPPVGASI